MKRKAREILEVWTLKLDRAEPVWVIKRGGLAIFFSAMALRVRVSGVRPSLVLGGIVALCMLIAYRILNRLDINSVIHPDPASEYLKARKAAPLALGFAMPFIWIALYHFASALPEPAYLNAVRYSLIAGAGICISTLLLSMLPATGSVFRYFYSGLGPAHGERDVSKNAAIAAAIGLTLVGIIDRAPVEARDLLWGIGSLMMGGAWLPYVVASGYALVLLGLYPGDTSDDSVV